MGRSMEEGEEQLNEELQTFNMGTGSMGMRKMTTATNQDQGGHTTIKDLSSTSEWRGMKNTATRRRMRTKKT